MLGEVSAFASSQARSSARECTKPAQAGRVPSLEARCCPRRGRVLPPPPRSGTWLNEKTPGRPTPDARRRAARRPGCPSFRPVFAGCAILRGSREGPRGAPAVTRRAFADSPVDAAGPGLLGSGPRLRAPDLGSSDRIRRRGRAESGRAARSAHRAAARQTRRRRRPRPALDRRRSRRALRRCRSRRRPPESRGSRGRCTSR